MENDEERKKRKKRLGILGTMMIGRKRVHRYVPGDIHPMIEAIETNVSSQFVVIKHEAKRAGLHYDLRFKMPKSNLWMSFSVRKGVPLKPGPKVLAVRTHDHTRKEALFTGTIKKGEYGAGKLAKWDGGSCTIIKFSPGYIGIDFKGSKVKGVYHLTNIGVIKKDYKKQNYWLFKGKET
jgi:DNA ligase D-like protein (predicted 3'-phosphoesterase)